jgi:hypothetical protein
MNEGTNATHPPAHPPCLFTLSAPGFGFCYGVGVEERQIWVVPPYPPPPPLSLAANTNKRWLNRVATFTKPVTLVTGNVPLSLAAPGEIYNILIYKCVFPYFFGREIL